MGEVADMMLDGTLCEGCGVYVGGTEHDIPLLCGHCAKERRNAGHNVQRLGKHWQDQAPKITHKGAAQAPKAKCPTCGRAVKVAGLKDHVRDAHGVS